ncbi:MAG: HAD hydrolase-like protein [Alphaproteobacteria bacterium]|nr:HAD hydrolase-like protein [Alphaproteobacteria bacterium]
MQPKLVIFDLDGTLVDGARAAIPAMQHTFDEVGLPQPNDAQVMDMIGLSITPAINHIINSFNKIRKVSDSEIEQIGDIYIKTTFTTRALPKNTPCLYMMVHLKLY